jgi:hypothetical protein
MHLASWLLWAVILFLQNISFTYVSRARSSGSILRHLKASIFSNGIWIFSQIIMLGVMFDNLTGKHGHPIQIEAASVYTVACVSGSIFAHYLAMKTEKGKDAVGYSKKYAQIPAEEWEAMKKYAPITEIDWQTAKARFEALVADFGKMPSAEDFQRVRSMAETAYDISVGMIPDSGIKACKVGGLTVTTGIPDKQ